MANTSISARLPCHPTHVRIIGCDSHDIRRTLDRIERSVHTCLTYAMNCLLIAYFNTYTLLNLVSCHPLHPDAGGLAYSSPLFTLCEIHVRSRTWSSESGSRETSMLEVRVDRGNASVPLPLSIRRDRECLVEQVPYVLPFPHHCSSECSDAVLRGVS